MQRIFLISLDFFETININDEALDFTDLIEFLLEVSESNLIAAYSRDTNRLKRVQGNFPIESDRLKFGSREGVRSLIKEYKPHPDTSFIVVGKKNKDFELAVNNKLILITPTWLESIENKPNQYGVKVDNTKEFKAFIETLVNQNNWYSKLTLPDETIVLSLADARTYEYFIKSNEEKQVLDEFKRILKGGERDYYEMFLYHFLSSISNNNSLFKDINYWGFFPSSDNKIESNPMFHFKEKIRQIMKGQPLHKDEDYRKYKNLLVRHTPTYKSHDEKNTPKRIKLGSSNHFETIRLVQGYKGKLRNKNICIFDDYLTHGSSFECARNLLRNEGVNKLIFVSLGRYVSHYQYQEYRLSGNVYSDSYDYELVDRSEIFKHQFEINEHAKHEVENLHKIFNL